MTATEFEQTLAVIATKAKDLRDAGISGRVSVGDVHFDLNPAEPAMIQLPRETEHEGNPLDDAETYGGEMPRRRGQPQETEDAPD